MNRVAPGMDAPPATGPGELGRGGAETTGPTAAGAAAADGGACDRLPPDAAAPALTRAPCPAAGGGFPLAEIGGDGAITVPMEIVARGLRVPVGTVLENLRAGLVYQVTETGVGEDAGRFRITFRYRSRQCRVVVDQGGRILPAD